MIKIKNGWRDKIMLSVATAVVVAILFGGWGKAQERYQQIRLTAEAVTDLRWYVAKKHGAATDEDILPAVRRMGSSCGYRLDVYREAVDDALELLPKGHAARAPLERAQRLTK